MEDKKKDAYLHLMYRYIDKYEKQYESDGKESYRSVFNKEINGEKRNIL